LAILFCLAFGVPFVYSGFQTVHIQAEKDEERGVVVYFVREYFWGVVKFNKHMVDVTNASLQTSRPRALGRRRLLSGVFLNTDLESVALLAGSSNVNSNTKWEVVNAINNFIDNENEMRLSKTFNVRNVFGWVGLPFLILGLLGLIGWLVSILRYLQKG
jgi:hypothetical protein